MLKPTQPWRARWLSSGMPCSERVPAIQPPPWTWTIAGRGVARRRLVRQVDVEAAAAGRRRARTRPRARAGRRAAEHQRRQQPARGRGKPERRSSAGGSSSASCSRTPRGAAQALPAQARRAPARQSDQRPASAIPNRPRSAAERAMDAIATRPATREPKGNSRTTAPAIQRSSRSRSAGAGAARSPCGSDASTGLRTASGARSPRVAPVDEQLARARQGRRSPRSSRSSESPSSPATRKTTIASRSAAGGGRSSPRSSSRRIARWPCFISARISPTSGSTTDCEARSK